MLDKYIIYLFDLLYKENDNLTPGSYVYLEYLKWFIGQTFTVIFLSIILELKPTQTWIIFRYCMEL